MNVLLTSAGRRSYMIEFFKNALSGQGEVHACNNELSVALIHADKAIISPDIYSNNYIDFLLKYCIKNDIKLVVPLFDLDLPVLSANRKLFEKHGIFLLVSDIGVVNICNDKYMTYLFLKKHNIATPETCLTIDETKKLLKEKKISFPLIVKPRWGMGSICLYQVDSLEELHTVYYKVKNDIFKTYVKYESEKDMYKCVIIQNKLVGQEYGIDVINDLSGNYITSVPKIKISQRAGETDIARVIKHKSLSLFSKKIAHLLKHIGNLDLDCFIANRKIYVLDLNCRFGGQYPFSHFAGINLPVQTIKWLRGEKTDMRLFSFNNDCVFAKDITLTKLEINGRGGCNEKT
mgnify:FL=1